MTKEVILISPYERLTLLEAGKTIQFHNGVAKLEFEKEADAKAFAELIASNKVLGPYVKVAPSKAEADKISEAHQNDSQVTQTVTGVQTSEAKADPKVEATNHAPAAFAGIVTSNLGK